jgi:hypothetical protein
MSNDDAGESYVIEGAGIYSVDDEDQPGGDDTLQQGNTADGLDEGYSPPERPLGVDKFGTTAAEQAEGETLDMRLAQEEPDPNLEVPDPLAEAEEDPDAPREADEFLDDGEVGDLRAGRLVAPDEGSHEDVDKDLIAGDVGIDGAAASAEEAAMHIVDRP